MISAPVRVVSAADGRVQVESTQQPACGACASRGACGVEGLGKYFSSRRRPVELCCATEVRAGDMLNLQLNEGDLLKAGLLAYLLPSLAAVGGAILGAAVAGSDAAAVLGAALGLGAGMLPARLSRWSPGLTVQSNHPPNEGEST